MPANRFAQLLRLAEKGKPKAKNAKRTTPKGPSDLELAFRGQIMAAGLTEGVEVEYRAIPGRQFRWDLAWVPQRLLVELQGGVWGNKGVGGATGHNTGVAINRDCEKQNLAVLAGWRCLSFTPNHVRSGQALKWVQEALGKVGAKQQECPILKASESNLT